MFDTKIPLYSIMILLSLIVNVIIVLLIYKKTKFTKDEVIGALVYENIGIIVGAKLFSYIHNYQQYGEFDFLSLGLSAYGGVIGAIICLAIFGLQFKKPAKEMLLIFAPSIPLIYAIGKIGCFFAGCCHGKEYTGWGSIVYKYAENGSEYTQLFPVQLIETILFTIIFIYIINKIMKNKFNLKVVGITCILCGGGKFILDYFRMSHVGGLSLNQIVSIFFIIIGIILIIKARHDYNITNRSGK